MSSSSSPAPEKADIRPFSYEQVSPDSNGLAAVSPGASPNTADEAGLRQLRIVEQARAEGEARAQATFVEQLARERQMIREAVTAFARERDAYYQKVEGEIVQLALAIARKILHREAQVDPLMLAGIVRVALDKLESRTEVMVRVNPRNVTEWRDYFSRTLEPRELPEVIEDPGIPPDRCVLQTVLGTTELGIETQLKEIERGLIDLLAHRPQVAQ
jgi:flagellar assembly protein FliH